MSTFLGKQSSQIRGCGAEPQRSSKRSSKRAAKSSKRAKEPKSKRAKVRGVGQSPRGAASGAKVRGVGQSPIKGSRFFKNELFFLLS